MTPWPDSDTFNILMYSHDTYGLGHIRRTMAIAADLLEENVNILILTGSPIVGRFDFPERMDFVRVPGMIKQSDDLYVPHSIKINAAHALSIRQAIITATATTFRPDLVIVDKAPLGLKKEILPMLEWIQREHPRTRTVLGLRDIMDDAESTVAEWREKDVYDILERFYTEIWVYGNRNFYDPIAEYAIPESISRKMIFTGYIPRLAPRNGSVREIRAEIGGGGSPANGIVCKEKVVVVTAGGGGDGYPMMDAVMRLVESEPDLPFRTVFVTGPFMPKAERRDLARRAKLAKARFYHFYRRMEHLFGAADLVVSMGGYNTICEVLSHAKASLIIPRETPRLEQRIRAEVLNRQGLVDYIPWGEASPGRIKDKIMKLLENPEPYREAIRSFDLTGLDVMRQRLRAFREEEGGRPA